MFASQVELVVQIASEKNTSFKEPPWYHLPGTGFDVQGKISQLQTDIQEGFSAGKNYSDIFGDWSNKLQQDVYGFSLEYLKGQAFLPFEEKIEIHNGVPRMLPSNYGNKPSVDLINPQERRGAVKKGITGVENFLLKAPVGSIVVRTSPPGRTDLFTPTKDGLKEIVYQDTQTQIYEKVSPDKIRSYTIRSDKKNMDIGKNQELLEFLGIPHEFLANWQNEEDRIALISGTNIYVYPDRQLNIRKIIEKMRELTGDRAFGDVSFDEVIRGAENFDQILQIDELTLAHTQEFLSVAQGILTEYAEDVISNQSLPYELIDRLELELGKAVLDLYIESKKIYPTQITFTDYSAVTTNFVNFTPTQQYQSRLDFAVAIQSNSYHQALTELQSIPGCAGGNSTNANETESPIYSQSTIFGPRTISLESPLSIHSHEKGTCSDCGGEKDGHYHCPNCNKEYADETSVAPENRTQVCTGEITNKKGEKERCDFKFRC